MLKVKEMGYIVGCEIKLIIEIRMSSCAVMVANESRSWNYRGIKVGIY